MIRGSLYGAVDALAVAAAALLVVQDRGADAKARELLERSRAAIAPAGTQALQSLICRGRVRIPQEGARFDEGAVEIAVLLPDQFVRVDTFGGVKKVSRDPTQFARLMLGAAGYMVPERKLAVRSTGAVAFEDTAAVDVAGPSFSARLVFDFPSLIPLRLTYFEKGSVSTVMSFADRRRVDGFLLPFRISTQVPERVLEILMFDDVVVNPALTKADFKR